MCVRTFNVKSQDFNATVRIINIYLTILKHICIEYLKSRSDERIASNMDSLNITSIRNRPSGNKVPGSPDFPMMFGALEASPQEGARCSRHVGRAPKPGRRVLVAGGQRHAIAFHTLFHTPFHTLFRTLGKGIEQLWRVTPPRVTRVVHVGYL